MNDGGKHARCAVVSGEKYLASAGGEQSLCAAIERATRGVDAKVEVTVAPRSRFQVQVTRADGSKLPVLNFMQADKAMSPSTFDWLASRVAAHIKSGAGSD